jgi:hypothetical protein
MSLPGATSSGESEIAPEEVQQPAQGEIDLRALAERLYQLLKEEARLERERLGRDQIG